MQTNIVNFLVEVHFGDIQKRKGKRTVQSLKMTLLVTLLMIPLILLRVVQMMRIAAAMKIQFRIFFKINVLLESLLSQE